MMSFFGATQLREQHQHDKNFFKNHINKGSTAETVDAKQFYNPSSLVSEVTTAYTSGQSSPSLSESSSVHNLTSEKPSINSAKSQCSIKSGMSNYYTLDNNSDRRSRNDLDSQMSQGLNQNNKSQVDLMLNLSNYGSRFDDNNGAPIRISEGFNKQLSPRSTRSYSNVSGIRSKRGGESSQNSSRNVTTASFAPVETFNERESCSYASLELPQNSAAVFNEKKSNHLSDAEMRTKQLPEDSAIVVAPGGYSPTGCINQNESRRWLPPSNTWSSNIKDNKPNSWSATDTPMSPRTDTFNINRLLPAPYSQATDSREGEVRNWLHTERISPQISNTSINDTTNSRDQANNMFYKSPQSWVDYGRMKEFNKLIEKKMVHEGFETRVEKIPLFRPVDIIEKIVEVPVVQTVDTYVPKVEVVEVPKHVIKPVVQTVEKFIEIPKIHYNDKIVEVPDVQKVVRSIPKLEIREVVKIVPKCEVKVIPKYVEVPIVKICNKYKEIEEIHEVLRPVVKVHTIDVPRQVIKKVPKIVKQVIEQKRFIPVIEYRDVPIEKIRYVPKVKTIEKIRHIPKIIDIEVPQIVHKHQVVDRPYYTTKYRDNYVFVPVRKTIQPVIRPSGNTEYVEVPLHKPYIVTHDIFKPKEYPVPLTPGRRHVSTVPCNDSYGNKTGDSGYYMNRIGSKSSVYPLTPQSSYHTLPNFDSGGYPLSGGTSRCTNSPIHSPRF